MELKDVGRGILAILAGYLIYQMWSSTRVNDPEYYSLGAAIIGAIVVFILLHLIGKEG